MLKLQLALIYILCSVICFAQSKLLVTDFVFFNDFNNAANAKIPNFFVESPEKLDEVKSHLVGALQEKYGFEESTFFEGSTSFIESDGKASASKLYRENHKGLIKKGGFTHYFFVSASVSGGQSEKYTFRVQAKLSNSKGKKEFNNTSEISFSALFRDGEIGTSDLIEDTDFYKLLKLATSAVLENQKSKITPHVFYRPYDTQFEEFAESAISYKMMDFNSQNPILVDNDGSEIPIRVRGGNDSGVDITNAGGGLLLVGEKVGEPITLSIRNPMLKEAWGCIIQAKANSGFEDLNLAPSADVQLRIGDRPASNLRLINGRLTGRLDSKTYLVSFEPSASLLRIFVDQKLRLLSQPLEKGKGQDLKLFYAGSEEELAKIINMNQVYFQSVRVLNQDNGK